MLHLLGGPVIQVLHRNGISSSLGLIRFSCGFCIRMSFYSRATLRLSKVLVMLYLQLLLSFLKLFGAPASLLNLFLPSRFPPKCASPPPFLWLSIRTASCLCLLLIQKQMSLNSSSKQCGVWQPFPGQKQGELDRIFGGESWSVFPSAAPRSFTACESPFSYFWCRFFFLEAAASGCILNRSLWVFINFSILPHPSSLCHCSLPVRNAFFFFQVVSLVFAAQLPTVNLFSVGSGWVLNNFLCLLVKVWHCVLLFLLSKLTNCYFIDSLKYGKSRSLL